MVQSMTLHAHSTGPNPYKIALLLEALNLPYDVKLWDFGDGEAGLKGPKFLKISENGRVPVLVDPNTSVTSWESGACINYLLRAYDTSHKFSPGPDAPEQLKVDFDKWIFFLCSSVGPMMGQLNWFKHYHATSNPDALERYIVQSYRTYDVMEGELKKTNGKSFLSSGYSAVDMHVYPWVAQHKYAGMSLGEYPMLSQWVGSVAGRPEVQKGYEKVAGGTHA